MNKWIPAAVLICIAAGVGFFLFSKSSKQRPKKGEASQLNSPALAKSGPVQTSPGTNQPAGAVNTPVPINDTNAAAVSTALTAPLSAPATLQTPSTAAEVGASDVPPAMLLENVRKAIRDFGQRMGGNPVGNNAEITKALDGGNPKEVKFLSPDKGMRINEKGELVDSWGTPFFFHQLSGTEMEIRSAGPDKKMWTSDDIVTQ